MATLAPAPAEQRLRLSDVDWPTYEMLLQRFAGRHLRITYDRGEIEIMVVSPRHERAKTILRRFVDVLTVELNVPVVSLGNTTFRREDLERGLEPDECWYIAHEAQMRDADEIDLTVDPPPDLAIEVEVTQSLLNRMSIYARLGVPEIWRYNGERLSFCVLGSEGQYTETDRSPTFPQITTADLMRFLNRRGQTDETQLVKDFRTWVQEQAGNNVQR